MSLYFTKDHEWIRVEGDTATVGISDHAQNALGDIVFAEAPEAGRALTKGGDAAVVDAEGSEVGKVTSGGFSPSLEAPIAMAYVPTGLAVEDGTVSLVQRSKVFTGRIVPMPFVPHRYHRKGAPK